MQQLPVLDLAMLITLPLIGLLATFQFHLGFFLSSLLYFGLPALYLSIRTPRVVPKVLLFSAVFSVLGGIVGDYIALLDNSWFVPTIFPFRFLGSVTVEEITWFFAFLYVITLFFEHFFDKGKHRLLDKRSTLVLYICLALIAVMIYLAIFHPVFRFSYFYFWFDLLIIFIPATLFFSIHPKLLGPIIRSSAYFFVIGIIFELTGLQQGFWTFPGEHYVGLVSITGHSFPIEELLAFIALPVVLTVVYYDFFDDSSHIKIQEKIK